MTPTQVSEARRKLGLSLEQLATLLGYQGVQRRQMMWDIENGRKPLREPQRRLLQAYLEGYQPLDWPVTKAERAEVDRIIKAMMGGRRWLSAKKAAADRPT